MVNNVVTPSPHALIASGERVILPSDANATDEQLKDSTLFMAFNVCQIMFYKTGR